MFKKWLAIINVVCDNRFRVKRGTISCLCVAFSRSPAEKHVDVEYRFSAGALYCALTSIMCQFYLCYACANN
ncbi:DUF2627 domain-containing protein [Escherichia coli]